MSQISLFFGRHPNSLPAVCRRLNKRKRCCQGELNPGVRRQIDLRGVKYGDYRAHPRTNTRTRRHVSPRPPRWLGPADLTLAARAPWSFLVGIAHHFQFSPVHHQADQFQLHLSLSMQMTPFLFSAPRTCASVPRGIRDGSYHGERGPPCQSTGRRSEDGWSPPCQRCAPRSPCRRAARFARDRQENSQPEHGRVAGAVRYPAQPADRATYSKPVAHTQPRQEPSCAVNPLRFQILLHST